MQINKPCCIDLYHSDNVSDNPTPLGGLDQVKRTGVFILIHKATESVQYRDSRYDARREKWMSGSAISVTDTDGTALSLSPLWGAYHFFHGQNIKDEVANFLMTSRLQKTDMAFIDWEAVGASGYQPSIEAADAFCSAVEDALGRPCGVYGGNVPRERFEAEKASSEVLDRFAARPLWFCAYGGVQLLQELPLPWKEKANPWLWQDDGDKYGPGPHTMPGISDYCDNSTVVDPMTFAHLHNLWLEIASEAPSQQIPQVAPSSPGSLLQEVEDEVTDERLKLEEAIKKDMERLRELVQQDDQKQEQKETKA